MRKCAFCGKETDTIENYYNWQCHVDHAKEGSGKIITPNNLPITCIRVDGTMLEHEHGDHQDYKFPVEIEFIGDVTDDMVKELQTIHEIPFDITKARDYYGETHALIYNDGNIAVTMYECCYAMWNLRDGSLGGGSLWKPKQWQLSKKSRGKIHDQKK